MLLLFADRLTAPKPPNHSAETQKRLDQATSNHTLYQLVACPFCVKVRRQIRRQGLNIRMKDIAQDPRAGAELITGGKLDQVPCLRIDEAAGVRWLYESDAINEYLKKSFGAV